MITRGQKNQNSVNLFLNSYFNIITVVVLLLFLAVSYFMFIKPKFDATMGAIQSNIEQQQKLYTDQQKKLANLEIVSDLYKKIPAGDLKKFNGVLPDSYIKERLFGELEEIISKNGFILNAVNISQEEKKLTAAESMAPRSASVGTISLQLSVSAIDYAGFKNLLRLLENNLRLFDITQVSFSPSGNTASLVLSTYYYKK
jgi:hypothetical protein